MDPWTDQHAINCMMVAKGHTVHQKLLKAREEKDNGQAGDGEVKKD